MITCIKFVSIPTTDQDRAVKFWTEQIGFKLLTDQPMDETQRWIELSIRDSDTRLVLFMRDAGTPESFFYGALACDDVDATYRQLSARGVEFTAPATREHWGSFAKFKDPDGNEFVLSGS